MYRILIVALAFLILGATCVWLDTQSEVAQADGSGLADSPWPMFRHDPQHTGRSPYSGPTTPELRWSYTTGAMIESSPAIGADGTIYVGSSDSKLYAVGVSLEHVNAAAALDTAASSIADEKSKGFDVTGAENLLAQAQQAFDNDDYQTALELASEALELAVDIDQDGVPNDRDFAPGIKNIYIYAGGSAFAVVLIVSASSFLTLRWRRKHAEKELIEKEKAEIIDMIDEALNDNERK